MGVDHTTIGRRLTSLERSIGAALFLRGADGLQLTQLGERLMPLVEEVERAVASVREAATSQKPRVRLAVPSGFTRFFTEDLAQLRKERPELSLELLSSARPVDLKRGEADLAIRIGPVTDEDLVVRKLGEAGWSLYASEAYLARRAAPADPHDLAGHEVIGFDASLAALPAAQWLEQHAGSATIVLRNREMTDMLAAALSGVGLAVLPCQLGDAEPRLRRLTPEVLARRPLSLVYRREARLADPVQAVIGFVMDVMRRHADAMLGATRSP
jgi:DNA-binding transcriptional LysR family regulator